MSLSIGSSILQLRLLGAIDLAYSALTELPCDAAMAERLAEHGESTTGKSRNAIGTP
jgi:hypothetical protein